MSFSHRVLLKFFRAQRRSHLRLFIASDLHGSTRCFRKLMRAPEFYEADALLIAGDLTGKLVIPIVAHGDEYISTFQGTERRLTEDEVVAHEQVIEDAGLYAYRTTPDEVAELEKSRDQVDAIFQRLVMERLECWLSFAEERLAKLDRDCFVIAGNDDYKEVDDLLRQGKRVKLVDGICTALNDSHEIAGLGVANPTPWHAPRDVPEQEIAERLASVAAEVGDMDSAIFLIHVPPVGSSLDLAPELDENLRPTHAGSNFIHIGSIGVRDFIAEAQPLLAVHGHVHESRGIDHIGRTTCINPGSEYGEGILRGALVNLSGNSVGGHLFVSG